MAERCATLHVTVTCRNGNTVTKLAALLET
jgi:hypothetical protein